MRPIRALAISVLCQVAGLLLALTIAPVLPHPMYGVAIHSLLAFLLAHWFKLARPWQLFNLIVPPAAILVLIIKIPAWFVGGLLALALLVYIPTFWTHVPYYPTSQPMYEAILDQLPRDQSFTFIDLGSGFGRLLTYLAKHCPKANFVGVELSPLPLLISKLRALRFGERIKISPKDFWNLPLSEFNYVYAFLAPPPMPRLWQKAKQEMRPGNTFMTNSFAVPAKADKQVQVDDKRRSVLYVHYVN